MVVTCEPSALFSLATNPPINVERRWPAWKGLAIFGELITFITAMSRLSYKL